jgi:hypothetical protein
MSENAKSDLNKYKNLNLISPKIFTGPSDEILQKKISFQNHSFGSQTETINIDIINGWIRNMTLRIELDALTTEAIRNNKNGVGYLNWVDSIGHAIIESINLKLGNTSIFDSTFPYGLWLDIYNELNDHEMLEWGMIGKHSSIDGLKKYETNKSVLYVPLHLWFSESLETALPYFLFPNRNAGLQISINLRNLDELVICSSSNVVPTNVNISSLELIYDVIQIQGNDLTKMKEKYRKIPYQVYFNKIDYNTQPLSSIINLNFDDAPISKLIFVIRNNSRLIADSTPQINEHYTDLNGNDIFNYGNTELIVDLGTHDTFNILNIDTKNETFDTDLDSIYYRKITNINNGKHVPQKHIYTVPFNYDSKDHSFLGFLNYKNTDTLKLTFTDNASNSRIDTFGVTCNKLDIDSRGSITINNWYNNSIPSESMSGINTDDLYKRIYTKLFKEVSKEIDKKLGQPICQSIPYEISIQRENYMTKNNLLIVISKTNNTWNVLAPKNIIEDNIINTYGIFKEIDESKVYKITNITKTTIDKSELSIFILSLLVNKSGPSKLIDSFFIKLLDVFDLYKEGETPMQSLFNAFKKIFINSKYKEDKSYEKLKKIVEKNDDAQFISKIIHRELCYETITNDNENSSNIHKLILPWFISFTNSLDNYNSLSITFDSPQNLLSSNLKAPEQIMDTLNTDDINKYLNSRIQKNLSTLEEDIENNTKVETSLKSSMIYLESSYDIEYKLSKNNAIADNENISTNVESLQNDITLKFYLDNYPFKGIPSFTDNPIKGLSQTEAFRPKLNELESIKEYLKVNTSKLDSYTELQTRINELNKEIKESKLQRESDLIAGLPTVAIDATIDNLQIRLGELNNELSNINAICKEKLDDSIKVYDYNPYLIKTFSKDTNIDYKSIINDFIQIYQKIYLEHSQYEGYKECSTTLKQLILDNIIEQITKLRDSITNNDEKSKPKIVLSTINDIDLAQSNLTKLDYIVYDNINQIDQWLNSNNSVLDSENKLWLYKNNTRAPTVDRTEPTNGNIFHITPISP